MSHGKQRRGGAHEEEHENHERWAVSYSDMMTVLMALFLVLFAMSNVDQKKYLELRTSLAEGFGNAALPTDGGSGVVDGSTESAVELGSSSGFMDQASTASTSSAQQTTTTAQAQDAAAAAAEASDLKDLQDRVEGDLAAQGLQDAVKTTITERGLEITVVANDIFFASASAQIQPRGYAVLDAIGPVLAGTQRQISVEGHANNLALTSGPYANNWELSSARATSVLMHLTTDDGVAGSRLQSVGFGDAHPLYPDDDPRAVEGNRRVDIVVASDASDDVKALLPQAAAAAGSAAPTDVGAGAAPEVSAGIAVDAAPDISADAAPSGD